MEDANQLPKKRITEEGTVEYFIKHIESIKEAEHEIKSYPGQTIKFLEVEIRRPLFKKKQQGTELTAAEKIRYEAASEVINQTIRKMVKDNGMENLEKLNKPLF